MPTRKGYELAYRLQRALPPTLTEAQLLHLCSRICKLAATYQRIQEKWCNESMDDRTTRYWERREARIEATIRDILRELPRPLKARDTIRPVFGSIKVKLAMPEPWTHLHNDWGRVGVCVP